MHFHAESNIEKIIYCIPFDCSSHSQVIEHDNSVKKRIINIVKHFFNKYVAFICSDLLNKNLLL